MPPSRDVLVIGAGVAGLFAANFLARRGCRVTVLEHNHQPGGCLNGIWRKGFYFDAGDQSFEQGGVVFPLLHDLGLDDRVTFERTWYRLVTPDIDARMDREDALRLAFTGAFPAHAPELDSMFDEIQQYVDILKPNFAPDLNPLWHHGPARYVRLAGLAGRIVKHRQEFARMLTRDSTALAQDHLSDPMLREFFSRIGYRNMCLLVFAAFVYCWAHDYWYPRGGLQAFCDTLADSAAEHGAVFQYKATVEALLVERGRITGARLRDGQEHRAPWVIYTGDATKLVTELLPASVVDPAWRASVAGAKTSEALTSVYVGLDMPADALRECLQTHHTFYFPTYALHDPDTLDDPGLHNGSWLEISAPCITDPTLAPAGQSGVVLQTMAHANWHDRWTRPGPTGRSAYRALKRDVGAQMCATAEGMIPGLRDRIAWMDVGSPLSAERFTLNRDGASAGWTFDPEHALLNWKFQRLLTPVKNLVTAGHWSLWPGGVPAAALSGKLAADAVTSPVLRTGLKLADLLTGPLHR